MIFLIRILQLLYCRSSLRSLGSTLVLVPMHLIPEPSTLIQFWSGKAVTVVLTR
jgi:hypothetical protein